MEYPEIPTDNLYKFLALAGMALLVFSVSYPISKVIELEVQEVDANTHRQKIEVELVELERQVGHLEKKTDVTAEEARAIRKKLTDIKLALVDVNSEKEKKQIFRDAGLTTIRSLQLSVLSPDCFFLFLIFFFGISASRSPMTVLQKRE